MRPQEQLDVDLVDQLLKQRIAGLIGVPQIRQFTGGSSNLTYLIHYPDSVDSPGLVLRRPPFGTRPKSGHSMIREFRVMQGIKDQYPSVPHLYFHQPEEGSPLGSEFYVMRNFMRSTLNVPDCRILVVRRVTSNARFSAGTNAMNG